MHQHVKHHRLHRRPHTEHVPPEVVVLRVIPRQPRVVRLAHHARRRRITPDLPGRNLIENRPVRPDELLNLNERLRAKLSHQRQPAPHTNPRRIKRTPLELRSIRRVRRAHVQPPHKPGHILPQPLEALVPAELHRVDRALINLRRLEGEHQKLTLRPHAPDRRPRAEARLAFLEVNTLVARDPREHRLKGPPIARVLLDKLTQRAVRSAHRLDVLARHAVVRRSPQHDLHAARPGDVLRRVHRVRVLDEPRNLPRQRLIKPKRPPDRRRPSTPETSVIQHLGHRRLRFAQPNHCRRRKARLAPKDRAETSVIAAALAPTLVCLGAPPEDRLAIHLKNIPPRGNTLQHALKFLQHFLQRMFPPGQTPR